MFVAACCLVYVGCCVLFAVCCLLSVGCVLMRVVCCLLFVTVVRCLLFDVTCCLKLLAEWCLLLGVCSVLFVVRYSLLAVNCYFC